jgi:hypothetical protein
MNAGRFRCPANQVCGRVASESHSTDVTGFDRRVGYRGGQKAKAVMTSPAKSLQATRNGVSSSASRFTLVDLACLNVAERPTQSSATIMGALWR